MGIRCLIVHGDSELIINQVKDKISARHHYLKNYRYRVWDLLESFLAINFVPIPRNFNQIDNTLVGKGDHFDPAYHKRGIHGVKSVV